MQISKNTVVQLSYELRVGGPEGEFVEKTEIGEPLVFLFGQGQMIQMFEDNLSGLKVGDNFAFGIPSDSAYGPVFEDAIVDLPKEIFAGHEDLIELGNVVPMRGPDGSLQQGQITEIHDKHVVMDFNHPLAGLDLYFTGQVLGVRQATAEEIDHGHVHGEGGVMH